MHLRVHSTYSLGVGLSSPAEICRHARRVGFDTVALTDVNGTYGFIELHRAARELGVKPVYGVHLFLDWYGAGPSEAGGHTLLLLALDRAGLRNLCAGASVSASRRERGESFRTEDLDGLSGGMAAVVGVWRRGARELPLATRHVLAPLRERFGERLFVECRAAAPSAQNEEMAAMGAEIGVAPVLTQDVRYVGPERRQIGDLLASADDRGFDHRVYSEAVGDSSGLAHRMRSVAELSELYERWPEAYTNAAMIASLVQPDLLESMEEATAGTLFDTAAHTRESLDALARRMLRERTERGEVAAPDQAERRLDEELAAIREAGLEETLLAFHEIVARLDRAGVALGPGTGMFVQSLCAWLLGITRFDPYAVDPRFRPSFAAPRREQRVLDLQLPAESRPAAVRTIAQLFDSAGVGYVPSVEHITAARGLRMVARRLESPDGEFDRAIQIAANHPGVTLKQLCEENRAIGALYRRSAAVRELIAHAASIEGLPFGFIRAKRTLIVSPTPLREFLGHVTTMPEGERFVQATRDAFPAGRIHRIDIGTLRALGVCAALGSASAWSVPEPPKVLKQIAGDNLDGVYLLESPHAHALAHAFGVASFDDLVAFIALMRYRRGDLSFADRVTAYAAHKARAREAAPATPASVAAEALAETRGWLLFDDQVRDVVAALTGYDAGEAERLAARFQEEEPGPRAALRREFMARAAEAGVPLEEAVTWFNRLLRYAGRTVSRQRAIADALLVTRMLELRQRNPARFAAAVLDETPEGEARRERLERLEAAGGLLPPDVNASARGFRAEKGRVRPPLSVVEGVSEEVAHAIVRARGRRRFRGAEDFQRVAEGAGVSAGAVEALARAGALESVGLSPEDVVPRRRVPAAERPVAERRGPGQLSLGLTGPAAPAEGAVDASGADEDASPSQGNPREHFHVLSTVAEFFPHPSASPVELAGRIRDLRQFESSSGKPIGLFTLVDARASVLVFAPWERLAWMGRPLSDGDHVRVRGRV
ncbi:MAG: PHP domain-containing protein, partial [Candidatus Krumholzibacteria bacterium]|nr:PHP domain-containing protein [Candidatus Krumholzibacteria bacterium]